jgi:hypothetical protein
VLLLASASRPQHKAKSRAANIEKAIGASVNEKNRIHLQGKPAGIVQNG